MKLNNWTKTLAALGVVSMGSAASAADESLMTAVSGTTISGYVSTSALWKPGTGNGGAPGKSFADGAGQDGINLDVISLSISKPVDEGEWAAGYTTELWLGPDSAGIGSSFGGAGDIAVKQATVDLRIPVGNGIDVKMGLFDTIMGFEYANNPSNPNWSRSFGWSIEPTQHTGVLASYSINDIISVSGGIAESTGATINAGGTRAAGGATDESEKAYLAAISITAPESLGAFEGSNLYVGVVNGAAGFDVDTTSLYAGLTVPTPVDGLSVGASWDYRFNGVTATSWESAMAGYVSYAVSEKLTVNYRADYATGTQGSFGVFRANDDEQTTKVLANTVTLDYKLWENVITRAEVRHDHSLSNTKVYGGNATADADKNSLSFGLNVVYQF